MGWKHAREERRQWIARLLQAIESTLQQDNPSRPRQLIEDLKALRGRLERDLRDEEAREAEPPNHPPS